MPTLASAGDPQPHRHRQVAESFGTDPERYDRTRPRYPDALITALTADPDTSRPDNGPLRVLDVGTGTGIVARHLLQTGCAVLGVEPDPRMAAYARARGVTVEEATFERWDPAGRTVDLVVAGQTWHWVDPVAGAAQAARVLRPGGRLAVFWNVDQPPPAVAEAVTAAFRRYAPQTPMARRGTTTEAEPYAQLRVAAADGMRRAGFAEPQQWRFDWRRTYTRAQWLDLLPTQGGFALLEPQVQARVLDAVGAAVGDGFTTEGSTVAVTAALTGGGLAG